MARSQVVWGSSGALVRRYRELATVGSSPAFLAMVERDRRIIVKHYKANLLAGKNRYGRPLTPLKSPRRGPYEGATGPPRVPFRERSRAIKDFRGVIVKDPKGIALAFVIDDRGTARRGVHSLVQRLVRRAARPRAGRRSQAAYADVFRWQETAQGDNPRGREIAGIPPSAWPEIRRNHSQFWDTITRP